MTECESSVLALFRKSGALLEGHFVLRSGLHSRQFFQCALALQDMSDVTSLGTILAGKVRAWEPATIVAPAMGGLVIGQEVARLLNGRFIFVEKVQDALALRRGFTIRPGECCVIIEDVVTRGGRVRETMDIVDAAGGVVAGVGVLVDRSNGAFDPGVPFASLLRLEVETFDPERLPPDLESVPAVKPGS